MSWQRGHRGPPGRHLARTRIAPIGIAAALALALPLAGCAQPATEPTTAPSAPQPDASATGTPTESAEPSATSTEAASAAWETQDGAMRLLLPEGWSVDDRSAMGEASEMYNHEPGWLNDVVVLDADGDQMLWYREYYGDDSFVCAEHEWPLEVPIEPFGPALEDQAAPVLIVGDAGPAAEFVGDGAPGASAARMALRVEFSNNECDGFDESIWVGDRTVQVDAVADAPRADALAAEGPDPVIRFADEQAAHAWLDGDEAATLIDVLSSIEFTGAPMLDAAP